MGCRGKSQEVDENEGGRECQETRLVLLKLGAHKNRMEICFRCQFSRSGPKSPSDAAAAALETMLFYSKDLEGWLGIVCGGNRGKQQKAKVKINSSAIIQRQQLYVI